MAKDKAENSENPEKPVKKSAIMTEEKTAQLTAARAKAMLIAQQNREVREKEQAVKDLAKKIQKDKAEAKLQELVEHVKKPLVPEDVEEEIKMVKKPKKKKKIVYIDSSSSSDSEDEVRYVKRRSRRSHKHREGSDSDNEVPKATPKAPEPLEELSRVQLKHEMALMRRDMARKMMFKSGF